MNASVRTAIAAIGEGARTGIKYPQAIWDEQAGGWVCDAEVADTGYTAFTSKKKAEQITARLIVRRVRRKDTPEEAAGQGTFFPAWRYHAVFTDSPFETVQAEDHQRGHAIVEQVIADLYAGPLARLPSGKFTANAAWLVLAAITFNLPRAAGTLAGPRLARARTATVRRDLVAVPARAARSGRGNLTLHLPEHHHRAHEWLAFRETAWGPPPRAA